MMIVSVSRWRPWAAALMALAAASLARALPTPAESSADVPTTDADSVTQEQQVVVTVETPKPRMDIYGFAMLDMGYDFKQINPDWFDVLRPTKLPRSRTSSARRQLLRRRAAEPPRGEGLSADGHRRGQDHVRVRSLRSGQEHRTDDLPPAPRLGRARLLRRGPDLEPVHGPRHLPELARVLGATEWSISATCRSRWMPMQGQNELFFALERPGATADEGHFADRSELQPSADTSRSGLHGALPQDAAIGATCSSPALRYIELGSTRRRSLSTSPATSSAGA